VEKWVYKQEMCVPSWEMLVKKSELNPQKLAFSSAMVVLNGLPSKYDHLIVALDALGDDAKLTMEIPSWNSHKAACCRRNRGNQSAICVRHQW
jgi:hypothetical protein